MVRLPGAGVDASVLTDKDCPQEELEALYMRTDAEVIAWALAGKLA